MHRLTGLTRWGFLGENLLYLMAKPKAFDTWTPERQEGWRAKQKAYRQTPVYKAYQKAKQQKPEYKAKRKAYHQTPEYKTKEKAKQQKPERKAYRKAQRQTSEFKDSRKAYQQKPEYKAKQKVRQQIRQQNAIQQTAADQFFIMAGAAEQISKIIQPKETK